MKTFLLVLFLSLPVFAQQVPPAVVAAESPVAPDNNPASFRPNHWAEGLHLLGGVGVNGALFNSETSHVNAGIGLNFKTDVGWYVNDHFAVEVGSAVAFNHYEQDLLWDTLFTLGVRYRFHSPLFNTDAGFFRMFVGESPTVIFLNDSKTPFGATGASRAQINGPLVGLGLGYLFKTSGGLNWFVETAAAYQWLRFEDAIVDQKDVPIVLKSNEVGGSPRIFTLAFNVGLVLF
jgi:hypothetical protein